MKRGSVVIVGLDPVLGHEQRGVRPCVVVSDPDIIENQRFRLVCVLPVTGTLGEGLLYPSLSPGKSGLTKLSCAMVDQLRSIDKGRIRAVLGEIGPDEIARVDEGLTMFLGLGHRLA